MHLFGLAACLFGFFVLTSPGWVARMNGVFSPGEASVVGVIYLAMGGIILALAQIEDRLK